MTRENVVRWTCNVCQDVEETVSDKQPEGWVGYGFTDPGRPAGESKDIGHLCKSCYRSVRNAMSS